MYCGKCGTYVADGERCSCEREDAAKKSSLQTVLKVLALVFAVLAIAFQFLDMETNYRDYSISKSDYENYWETLEDESEDFSSGYGSRDVGFFTDYNSYEYTDYNSYEYYGFASTLLPFVLVAFALYIGAFVLSFRKKSETARAIIQGLFFCLLLVSLVFSVLATICNNGEYYAMPEPRYDSYYDDPVYETDYSGFDLYDYYSQNNYKYDSYYEETYLPIQEEGLGDMLPHSYYEYCSIPAIGWYLSVVACALGLAVTAASAFVGKKEY